MFDMWLGSTLSARIRDRGASSQGSEQVVGSRMYGAGMIYGWGRSSILRLGV